MAKTLKSRKIRRTRKMRGRKHRKHTIKRGGVKCDFECQQRKKARKPKTPSLEVVELAERLKNENVMTEESLAEPTSTEPEQNP